MSVRDLETEEKMFSVAVLYAAKKIFGYKAKYLHATKMVKLVALVAENVGYNLTRGWYKYGYYAPSAYDVITEFAGKDAYCLTSFEPPKDLVDSSFEKFGARVTSIENSIGDLEEFFVQKWKDFVAWVYSELVPPEYKNFYLTHVEFKNFLMMFTHYLKSPSVWRWQFDKFGPRLANLVDRYNNALEHIKDESILEIFRDFMRLLELVELRIENKNFEIGDRELLFLEDLQQFYINKQTMEGALFTKELWMLLIPYSETLVGNLADIEHENYIKKVEDTKEFLRPILSRLIRRAKDLDLLPSIAELEAKIRRLGGEYTSRGFEREIYEPIPLKTVHWEMNTLTLREPVMLRPFYSNGNWNIENEDLGIMVVAPSLDQCLLDFQEEFFILWTEYAQAPDETLTEDAKDLKHRIRALVLEDSL